MGGTPNRLNFDTSDPCHHTHQATGGGEIVDPGARRHARGLFRGLWRPVGRSRARAVTLSPSCLIRRLNSATP